MTEQNKEKTETYPEEYSIIFDKITISAQQAVDNNESAEINELRKAVLSLNEPEYTYTTSASGYTPTLRIN